MIPFKKDILLVSIIVLFLILLSCSAYAQDYPAGFYSNISYNYFVELSENQRKLDSSNLSLCLGFTSPQLLELYTCLGDEKLNYEDPNGIKKDFIDSTFSFQLGAKIFIINDIQIGVPVDFSFSFEFTQATHEEKETKNDYKHKKILGTGDIKWNYSRSEPYMRLGLLQTRLDTPDGEADVKEEPLLFIGGIKFTITPQFFILGEINMCDDVGYSIGVRYHL